MNKFTTILIIIILNITFILKAQQASDSTLLEPDNGLTIEAIIESIKNSDIKMLANMCNQQVDISLPDHSGIYSKRQAQFILSNFFSNNPTTSFHLRERESIDQNPLFLGKFISGTNEYRICFEAKKFEQKLFIYQIRIEK